jgi:hypothetical protein
MLRKERGVIMKWIVILLIAAAGIWAYYNVDFSNLGNNATNTIKQEKTMKKFFDADKQNKDETQKVIQENF